MRLTIINQFYPPDLAPTGRLAKELAEHRAGRGDTVRIVASRGGYADASNGGCQAERDNLRVHRTWSPQLGKSSLARRGIDYGLFYLLAALRMLTLPRQDVIIALTTPPFIAWTAVLHKLLHPRTRLILWNMDAYPEVVERAGVIKTGGFASHLLARMNRALFRFVDHLICLDSEMASLLVSRYAASKNRLSTSVIPNWEAADAFPADEVVPDLTEEEDVWFGERFVLLYTGNRGWGHRFDTVLKAADTLREEPVTFLFVGGGAQSEFIEKTKHSRRLDNVVLLDYVSDRRLRALMGAADCSLITLRDDMLGVMSPSKLHASLAMALPVIYIGPKKSNVDEAIRRFDCGHRLGHADHTGLVDSIRDLMNRPTRLQELSQHARQAFETQYSDACNLPRFDAVIDGREVLAPLPLPEVETPRRKAA